ncbi:MAG: hypothetical protein O3A36_01285, partial [bacterium]|nr:hypothetical protein [bacterium]
MNGKKKYTNFVATTLIAFVALFGVYPQDVFAAGPAVSGKYYGASYCGPCRQIKSTQNFQNAVTSGSLKDFDVANMPSGEVFTGSKIPQLQLFDAAGNPVGDPIIGQGDAMDNALEGLANQPPKQQDEKICIVPRPGQSPEFGPLTDNPGLFPIRGTVQDTSAVHPVIAGHIADESDVNFNLRKLASETMEIQLQQAEQQSVEKGTKKVIRPNQTQAEEFIKSMNGNADARGSYKIGGTDVPVGKYRANQKDQSTGITFDENCENPKQEGAAPDPGKTNPGGANPGFGDLGNGGGGNGGGGNGGGGNGGG